MVIPALIPTHLWDGRVSGLRSYDSPAPAGSETEDTDAVHCEGYALDDQSSLSPSYYRSTCLATMPRNRHPHRHQYRLLTDLHTPWCKVLLEQLTGLQLVKKFPAFHGTPRFITALTSVRHLSLSWAIPVQPIYPHPTSWRPFLILSTHLRLVLPSGHFPSDFSTKTLYTTLSSPLRATCPAHLILLDFITRKILDEEYRSFSSSLCNLLLLNYYYW